MLQTLFPRSYRQYESSLCADELKKFGCWLLDAGYSEKNTRDHLRRFRSVFEPAPLSCIDPNFTAEQLIALFTVKNIPAYRVRLNFATRRVYERFLHEQNRFVERKKTAPAFIVRLDDYETFLREVRGLAEKTFIQHRSTVSEFLTRSLLLEQSLADLTEKHINQYLSEKSVHLTRQSMQHIVARLRAFLRYCFDLGLIAERLDRIDTPRTYRDEQPPRALPWPQVVELLGSIDLQSKAGWRDYTILHLMAHYGLRASEVAALLVDSVDFELKLLRVEQRKTRSTLVLPMGHSTINILRQYLADGRPVTTHSELFLRARRPSGGIRHFAVCDLFKKRALQCGLPAEYSSYSLRHAFAMRLLQRGVGVKAIGDLLGHRSLESTCVYLRLDAKTLRGVALPVPQHHAKGADHE